MKGLSDSSILSSTAANSKCLGRNRRARHAAILPGHMLSATRNPQLGDTLTQRCYLYGQEPLIDFLPWICLMALSEPPSAPGILVLAQQQEQRGNRCEKHFGKRLVLSAGMRAWSLSNADRGAQVQNESFELNTLWAAPASQARVQDPWEARDGSCKERTTAAVRESHARTAVEEPQTPRAKPVHSESRGVHQGNPWTCPANRVQVRYKPFCMGMKFSPKV